MKFVLSFSRSLCVESFYPSLLCAIPFLLFTQIWWPLSHVPFLSLCVFLSSTGFTFSLVQATTSRHQRRQGLLVARQGCGANTGFNGIVSCVWLSVHEPRRMREGRKRTTSGTYVNGERESNMGILVHMKILRVCTWVYVTHKRTNWHISCHWTYHVRSSGFWIVIFIIGWF